MVDLTKIIEIVIALISALLTAFVIPWIKSKTDINNGAVSENQAAMIRLAIKTAVTAAEQIYNSDEGKQKKEYVVDLLRQQGINVDMPSIDAAIEAAVLELHNQLKGE